MTGVYTAAGAVVGAAGKVAAAVGLENISQASQECVQLIEEKKRQWHQRYQMVKNIDEKKKTENNRSTKWIPTPVEQEVVRNVTQHFTRDRVREKLHDESVEKRREALYEQVNILRAFYGVQLEGIGFFEPENEQQAQIIGFYNPETNQLCLNDAFVQHSGDATEELFYTACHELMHARQWAALLTDRDYGYTAQQLQQLYNNILDYKDPSRDPNVTYEEYATQPLELAAFGIEEEIRKYVLVTEAYGIKL